MFRLAYIQCISLAVQRTFCKYNPTKTLSKEQKQPPGVFYKKICSKKFHRFSHISFLISIKNPAGKKLF